MNQHSKLESDQQVIVHVQDMENNIIHRKPFNTKFRKNIEEEKKEELKVE